MFGLIIGNTPISYVIGSGILELIKGGKPPIVEFCYLLDEDGNQLLDSVDFMLTARMGRLYQLYGSNDVELDDLQNFPLGVRK